MGHEICSILFIPRGGCEPTDPHGCTRETAHGGPHRFNDSEGRTWEWERDNECDCDDCLHGEIPDQCVLYWESMPRNKPTAKRVQTDADSALKRGGSAQPFLPGLSM